jgi:hypothetical protein
MMRQGVLKWGPHRPWEVWGQTESSPPAGRRQGEIFQSQVLEGRFCDKMIFPAGIKISKSLSYDHFSTLVYGKA